MIETAAKLSGIDARPREGLPGRLVAAAHGRLSALSQDLSKLTDAADPEGAASALRHARETAAELEDLSRLIRMALM